MPHWVQPRSAAADGVALTKLPASQVVHVEQLPVLLAVVNVPAAQAAQTLSARSEPVVLT
jgi:hypothetical protein